MADRTIAAMADVHFDIPEPEETIISDETPHEIAEMSFADYNVRADIVESDRIGPRTRVDDHAASRFAVAFPSRSAHA